MATSRFLLCVAFALLLPAAANAGNGAGAADIVLSPWSPLKMAKQKDKRLISIWGRTYTLCNSVLPDSIETRGEQVLASPIRLTAVESGKPVVPGPASIELVRSSPTTVILSLHQESGSFIWDSSVSVEYDGMMWYEFSVTPTKPGATLDSLDLVIPLKPEHFRYRNFPADYELRGTNNVALGEEYVRPLPKQGYCWIGDEERGLSWFFERHSQFSNADAQKAVVIRHSADNITFTARFIDHPVAVKEPIKLAFGIQATPTRPLPRDWRLIGLGRWQGQRWDIPWTYEAWTRYGGGYPESNAPELYQRMITNSQQQGIKVAPYVNLEWRDRNSPDWLANKDEWGVPDGISDYSQERVFWHGNIVCPASADYRDWIAEKTNRFISQYKLDGLYHDMQAPYHCDSPRHGCEGGRWHILGAREMNRRVYAVIHNLNSRGLKIDHSSNCFCDPMASFADVVVTGEEFCGDGMDIKNLGPWRVNDDYFTIPDVRGYLIASGMAGGQRGPIPCFLPEEQGGEPQVTRGFVSLLLPNDAVWGLWQGRNDVITMHRLWRVCDDFGLGADDVRFHGYWREDVPVRVTYVPSRTGSEWGIGRPVVSVWSRGKLGALVAVANYSTTDDTSAELTLDLAKLRLKGPVKIADAENPVKWYPSSGKCRVAVRKKDYRLIWVRPGKTTTTSAPEIPQIIESHCAGFLPPDKPASAEIEISAATKFAQVISFEEPVQVSRVEVFVSEGKKQPTYRTPNIGPDEAFLFDLEPPRMEVVRVGADSLPNGEVVVDSSLVSYSQARPGESSYRMMVLRRLVKLEPGKYALVFSKKPESDGQNHTYKLAGYQTKGGGAGCFYDGKKWNITDKAIAAGVYGNWLGGK